MGLCDNGIIYKLMDGGKSVSLIPLDVNCLDGVSFMALLVPFTDEGPSGKQLKSSQEFLDYIKQEPYWAYFTCNGDGRNNVILFHMHNSREPFIGLSHSPRFFVPCSLLDNLRDDITLKSLFATYKEQVIERVADYFGGGLKEHRVPVSVLVENYEKGIREVRIF